MDGQIVRKPPRVYVFFRHNCFEEQGQTADAAAREGGDSDAAGVRGTRNLFRKEFGHLTQAAQDKFKEDSLWMGQAENVLRCEPYLCESCGV